VADFRLGLISSARRISHLDLEQWIPESTFRSETDVVRFTYANSPGRQRTKSKGMCPDGYFVIADRKRAAAGKRYRARFLLEIDMATHDNNSFGIEKAAAGAAYIQSDEYRCRFGAQNGRWLVITTSEVRLKNLMKHTHKHARNHTNLFYFSTLDRMLSANCLLDPIWEQPGLDGRVRLPFTSA
jgi:hypothetical protein